MKNAFSGWANGMLDDLNEVLWQSGTTFRDITESFGKMLTRMGLQIAASGVFEAFQSLYESIAQSFSETLKEMFNEWLATEIKKAAIKTALNAATGGWGGSIMNIGAPTHLGAGGTTAFGMADGGYIGERVVGVGATSGSSYEFHPNEYVIPQNKMPGGKSDGNTNVNLTIHAVDAKSVHKLFAENKGMLASLMGESMMNNSSLRTAVRKASR